MSNQMWKAFERQIANALGSVRNIGSGKINSNDESKPRPGDVVMPPELSTLVECKTRQGYPLSGIYYRAQDTLEEAKKEKLKNWFHFERKNGSKKIYVLATNEKWMEFICKSIREELDRRTENELN
jgi:hypothetical protein